MASKQSSPSIPGIRRRTEPKGYEMTRVSNADLCMDDIEEMYAAMQSFAENTEPNAAQFGRVTISAGNADVDEVCLLPRLKSELNDVKIVAQSQEFHSVYLYLGRGGSVTVYYDEDDDASVKLHDTLVAILKLRTIWFRSKILGRLLRAVCLLAAVGGAFNLWQLHHSGSLLVSNFALAPVDLVMYALIAMDFFTERKPTLYTTTRTDLSRRRRDVAKFNLTLILPTIVSAAGLVLAFLNYRK